MEPKAEPSPHTKDATSLIQSQQENRRSRVGWWWGIAQGWRGILLLLFGLNPFSTGGNQGNLKKKCEPCVSCHTQAGATEE